MAKGGTLGGLAGRRLGLSVLTSDAKEEAVHHLYTWRTPRWIQHDNDPRWSVFKNVYFVPW